MSIWTGTSAPLLAMRRMDRSCTLPPARRAGRAGLGAGPRGNTQKQEEEERQEQEQQQELEQEGQLGK